MMLNSAILLARRLAGHSREHFAFAVMGVNPRTVARWERGTRMPSAKERAKLVAFAPWLLPHMPLLPDAILGLRRGLGESRETFGRRLGVSARTVAEWERGNRAPRPPHARELLQLNSSLTSGQRRLESTPDPA
jgi:DNA-binding transcriptional regulator YiaG